MALRNIDDLIEMLTAASIRGRCRSVARTGASGARLISMNVHLQSLSVLHVARMRRDGPTWGVGYQEPQVVILNAGGLLRGNDGRLDMCPRRTLITDPTKLVFLFSQQPDMHSGFLTSGLGSPTNMLRFGILIAASVLASSVASAGSRPLRLRM